MGEPCGGSAAGCFFPLRARPPTSPAASWFSTQAIHRHALAAVAEARMQLAQRQFSEAAASEAERKAHIRALACQLQAGGQPAAAVAAQGGGSA